MRVMYIKYCNNISKRISEVVSSQQITKICSTSKDFYTLYNKRPWIKRNIALYTYTTNCSQNVAQMISWISLKMTVVGGDKRGPWLSYPLLHCFPFYHMLQPNYITPHVFIWKIFQVLNQLKHCCKIVKKSYRVIIHSVT